MSGRENFLFSALCQNIRNNPERLLMIEDIILIILGRVFNMCHELEKFSMFLACDST